MKRHSEPFVVRRRFEASRLEMQHLADAYEYLAPRIRRKIRAAVPALSVAEPDHRVTRHSRKKGA
jgi:hypothetical protein